jgi:hypothetical protein
VKIIAGDEERRLVVGSGDGGGRRRRGRGRSALEEEDEEDHLATPPPNTAAAGHHNYALHQVPYPLKLHSCGRLDVLRNKLRPYSFIKKDFIGFEKILKNYAYRYQHRYLNKLCYFKRSIKFKSPTEVLDTGTGMQRHLLHDSISEINRFQRSPENGFYNRKEPSTQKNKNISGSTYMMWFLAASAPKQC